MPIRPMLAAAWAAPRCDGPPLTVLDAPPQDGAAGPPGEDAVPVDALIAAVRDRLRPPRAPLADDELHAVAEEIVLETVRVVLGWLEGGAGEAAGAAG